MCDENERTELENIPGIEFDSSSNDNDAPNAMKPRGWSPSPTENKPTITVSLPKDLPLMEMNFKTEGVDSVKIEVLNSAGQPVYSKTVTVSI